MTEAEYKYARENFVEHKVEEASRALCFQGLNPTGRLFKQRIDVERKKYQLSNTGN